MLLAEDRRVLKTKLLPLLPLLMLDLLTARLLHCGGRRLLLPYSADCRGRCRYCCCQLYLCHHLLARRGGPREPPVVVARALGAFCCRCCHRRPTELCCCRRCLRQGRCLPLLCRAKAVPCLQLRHGAPLAVRESCPLPKGLPVVKVELTGGRLYLSPLPQL